MPRITADEARKLSGPTVEERVEEVYEMILAAATQGRRRLSLADGWWAHEGFIESDAYKQACEILQADGFKVDFFYEERQFVHMGTSIEW